MRLVLLNGNSSPEITALMVANARRVAAPGTAIGGITAPFGARYVASRAAYAIAGHAALDAYAGIAAAGGADAVILACFGDPGLAALREVETVPVVGMAEAACLTAAENGRRFAIVTGGYAWVPMLNEFVAGIGLAGQLAGVRAVAPTGGEIAADPEASAALLAKACRDVAKETHADVVILGGAGLAGIAPQVAAAAGVPVIDALAASVRYAEALLPASRVTARLAADAVESVGLSPRLRALLAQEG
jgi:allantoin racemase